MGEELATQSYAGHTTKKKKQKTASSSQKEGAPRTFTVLRCIHVWPIWPSCW